MPKTKRIWQRSDQRLLSGIDLQKDLSGTQKTAVGCGTIVSRLSKFVSFVAKNLNMSLSAKTPDSVPTTAKPSGEKEAASITSKGHVLYAVVNSLITSIAKQEHVQMPVRFNSIERVGQRMPVYNLTVEGSHNFFANGILVHNCDVSRYLVDYLAQIGYMGDYVQSEWTPPTDESAPDAGGYSGPY